MKNDRAPASGEIDRITTEPPAASADREAAVDANRQLAAQNAVLKPGYVAASVGAGRLASDNAAVNTELQAVVDANRRLELENAALAADRKAKAETIDRLLIEKKIQTLKLNAKSEIIRATAAQELERKEFFGGSTDVIWHRYRSHVTPSYGHLVSSQQAAGRLHVAVDTLEIIFGVSGGVETYMKMLVSALLEGGNRVTLICLSDQLAALQKQFSDRVSYFVVRASRAMELTVRMANMLGKRTRLIAAKSMATFARLAEDLGVDVLHSPVQIFSTLDFRVPAVLNLHDLQHLHFPKNFRDSDIAARNYLYGLSASLSDAVVVSSDFVRNDLITQMQVPASKVITVPVTWDPAVEKGLESFSADRARAYYRLPEKYAIYPAHFWPHKNHVRLIEALRIMRDRVPGSGMKLVLTGNRDHSGWPKVEETIRRLNMESDVICLDHVPVEHLAGLYKGAMFCVVASTFEASSYPVIEAQILGVPAMCSNVTSLPELMRDGSGLLFDPYDVDDIAATMIRWVEDPADRSAHAERGFARARREHSITNYISGINHVYQYAISACK